MFRTLEKHWKIFGARALFYTPLAQVARALSIQKEVLASIPGDPIAKVLVRLGTSDVDVFEEIFLDEALRVDLDWSPRFIIDGGAYVGYSTLYLARRYPRAIIVAVEPEKSNYSLLLENVRGCENVHVERAALWGEEEVLEVIDPGRKEWGFLARPASCNDREGSLQIKAVTIPQILDRYEADRIDLLKLDIEGGEKSVFSHSQDWIGKTGCLLVELHDHTQEGCSDAFDSSLGALAGSHDRRGTKQVFIREDFPPATDSH